MPSSEKNFDKTLVKMGHCFGCHHDSCQIAFHIKDDKIVRVTQPWHSPIRSAPIVEGCPKARSFVEWNRHPDRLNFPLKRVGGRGENKWEKLSWDQALDEIANRLRQIKEESGPEYLTCIDGFSSEQWASQRFFHLFGSPNCEATMSRICKGDLRNIHFALLGRVALYGPPSERCNCLVAWGSAHSVSGTIMWAGEKRIKDLGGKLIVIDPRQTTEAKIADIWLQLRPGTDGAIAMGWLNIIINEELYDKEFVKNWTIGFPELKERVKKYTPKVVSEITSVPIDHIIESARMYAIIKPASINWGTKVSHIGPNATKVEQARCILRAITGNIDVDGGDRFQEPPPQLLSHQELDLAELLSEEQAKKALGWEYMKLKAWPGFKLINKALESAGKKRMPSWANFGALQAAIFDAIVTGKPYRPRAILLPGANPLILMAQTQKVYEALKCVEFSVGMDVWMTPSMLMCDYVLPGAYWLESPSIGWVERCEYILGGDRILPKKVEGVYDRADFYDFWRGLGIRLGQELYWPWKTTEENLEFRLKKLGVTWDEWRKQPWMIPPGVKDRTYLKDGRFPTPSGKVEIKSSILEQLGLDPLPDYQEPPESPVSTQELFKEYSLILITGARIRPFLHSQFRQISSTRRMHPDPLMEINPETAKESDLKDGDWVWIETKRGRAKQRCRIFEGIKPGVVHAEYGWWFPETKDPTTLFGAFECNINMVTSQEWDHLDKTCGNWYLNAMLCKIYKAQEPAAYYGKDLSASLVDDIPGEEGNGR